MLKMTESGPDISYEDIKSFEAQNGITLPDEYKKFLLNLNGGKPEYNLITIPEWAGKESDIDYMLSLCSDIYSIQWYRNECILETNNDYLIFAICGDGNKILLGINSINYGQIYFWDSSPDYEEENNGKTVYFLAESFNKFLEMIHEYKE